MRLFRNRKLLLRVAAFLILFTFLGHTFGAFSAFPAEQVERAQVFARMQSKVIPMPGTRNRSYAEILLGANICLSLFLLLSGLVFILESREKTSGRDPAVLLCHCVAMILVAGLSLEFFFPLPAICTGLAGGLGLLALRVRH
jgi:hypothetical protein